jgi:hypothetical protein
LESLRTAEHDEWQSNEENGEQKDPGHGLNQSAISDTCLCDENLNATQIIISA